MILKRVHEILQDLKDDQNLIGKIRWSPDNKALIVDINYNKVLRISVIRNEVHIQGDLNTGNKLKQMIEGAINNVNQR